MLRRAHWSLWLLLLAAACNPLGDFAVAVDPLELGVAVRLEAVTLDLRQDRLYIVGSGGRVIDDRGDQWELPATLRDVIHVEGDDRYPSRPPRLIVVGPSGFVASAPNADDATLEFEVEAVGARGETHRGSECVTGARGQGPKPQLYRAYYKVSGHRDRAPGACSGS